MPFAGEIPGLDVNLESWFVSEGLDFIFTLFSGDWTGFLSRLLLGPFALFFGDVFKGRPKVGPHSASDSTALFFAASPNPVIQLWGLGIRGLEAKGIPTSVSGGAGLKAHLDLADKTLANLKRQFDNPKSPRLTFQGLPATGLNVFTWYHTLGFRAPNPASNRAAINERALIDALYNTLVRGHYIDPRTGFPPVAIAPPPPPPPPDEPILNQIRDCICVELVPQVEVLAVALATLRANIGGSPQATVAAGFDRMALALAGLEACLCAALTNINTHLLPAIEHDLARTAAAAETVAGKPEDVAAARAKLRAFIKQAEKDGLYQADLGQIVTS